MSTAINGIIKARPNCFNMVDPKAIRRREGWNPRFDFGEIEELAKSIKAQKEVDGVGVLIPLRLKRTEETGIFELIDGDRRLTAVQHLESKGEKFEQGIPAILEDKHSSDMENMIKMFESNSGKPFLPLEEAEAYRRMHAPVKEGGFGMTFEQISSRVGKAHVHIVDTLRLLQADASVQEALKEGSIGITAAKAIAKADKGKQQELVGKAADAKGKKGARKKLMREMEDNRANKRAATKAKIRPLDPDEIQALVDTAIKNSDEQFKAVDWTPQKAASEIRNDDEMIAAHWYGYQLGLQAALGIKVKVII